MGILNLEEQLIFYGSYHSTRGNILLHLFGVPSILYTTLLFASNTPTTHLQLPFSVPPVPVNLATVTAAFYAVFYILLDPMAGGMLAPLIVYGAVSATGITADAETAGTANLVAGVVWVVAWVVQFVGHGVFERRAPALLDSFWQALVLAPLFVWFEVLFWVGYREGLRVRVERGVRRRVEEFGKGGR